MDDFLPVLVVLLVILFFLLVSGRLPLFFMLQLNNNLKFGDSFLGLR
jgi:hypothetical protein